MPCLLTSRQECQPTMNRWLRSSVPIFMLLLAAGARPAAADHSPHGRVSSLRGDLLVKGPDDEDWSYVERNAVVADGDLLQADEESLAEIEMEQGTWLRL